ncbi:MAG: glycosyltransferase family 39 protein [Candidatus Shapirobacteria bacterium]|jgi:hypothetical protein
MSFKVKIILLFSLAIFTRFFCLGWGQGNFFHPDENNMATSLSQLSSQNLNPHFFAYGQFPLYLGFFTLKIFGIANTFINSIFILRFYSAVFSLLSLYFFYKIYPRLSFVLLLIFTPGLIQLSHFGTTESLLILTFVINLYLTKLILKKPSSKLFLFAALNTGIAIATKISGAIFIFPIFLAAVISQSWLIIPYAFLTSIFSILFSPYNFLAWSDFLSSMRYETAVATGSISVFYTTQFSHSLPYIFQITKIFPYVNGWSILLFALLSIPLLKFIKDKRYYLIIFISCFIYFLYFGQLYVKWTRFMSPLFFVLPLLSAYFISTLKSRFYRLISIVLACLPGIFFMINYFLPDTRLAASQYLLSQLPANSTILSESSNVVNLPVLPNNFNVINYDFYNNYSNYLSSYLLSTNYIIIPSRRVFKNYSLNYYQHLFDGTLGFQEIKKFPPFTDFFLNPENAEETWSVFDRPTIRIYKKVKNLTLDQYENLL